MHVFSCPSCGAEIHFNNVSCLGCGRRVGVLPDVCTMTSLEPLPDGSWRAVSRPDDAQRLCQNDGPVGCNWLVPASDPDAFCVACRHNRVVPDIATFSPGVTSTLDRWRAVESAKRRLFWSLLRWGLPHPLWSGAAGGLGFDFLTDADGQVMTGHHGGIITLNLAEGDATERTRLRQMMGEVYRTPIGHFRHEIGHFYWDMLVRDGGRLDDFRRIFGDDRQDYTAALEAHYRDGAPPDWATRHVSPYAAAHPWEDFAESWAHWMHMVEGLETAQAHDLRVGPTLAPLSDPYRTSDAEGVARAWVDLTLAVNAVNRSMGQPDIYPFILSPAVLEKLHFINALIHGA
jgi:hypothetical protein